MNERTDDVVYVIYSMIRSDDDGGGHVLFGRKNGTMEMTYSPPVEEAKLTSSRAVRGT